MKKTFGLLAAAAVLSACGGEGGQVIVVYSPHGREMLEAFERRFEELHPGVDVQWVDMGSQEVLDRIRSERANPQADVWWGAPAHMFEDAAAEGLLEKFVRPGRTRSRRTRATPRATGTARTSRRRSSRTTVTPCRPRTCPATGTTCWTRAGPARS